MQSMDVVSPYPPGGAGNVTNARPPDRAGRGHPTSSGGAHPTVSRRPPGNALSGLPLSLIDRTRDVVDAAVRRAPDRFVPAGRAVSQGLAGLAGLVERIPLFRRGDKPPTSR